MGTNYERKLKKKLEERGWFVARAAGSLGNADLLATKPTQGLFDSFLFEVKATVNEKAFYFTDAGGKAKVQWADLQNLTRQGFKCLFAVYYKRGERKDRWRFFPVTEDDPRPLHRNDGLTFNEVFGSE